MVLLCIPSSGSLLRLHGVLQLRRNVSFRKLFAEKSTNRFCANRVMHFGPELACLEWLMECGTSEVIMSDGTSITCIAQMREYIRSHGFDMKKIPKQSKEFKWSPVVPTVSMKKLNAIYSFRWQNKPSVHVIKVDATDSAIADPGFSYFRECRNIEVLKLNFCEYFGDIALEQLALGRTARTLLNLEIVANPYVTDEGFQWVKRLRSLQRAHFYFLPCVEYRKKVVDGLNSSLPKSKITFPEIGVIGYGYDAVTE